MRLQGLCVFSSALLIGTAASAAEPQVETGPVPSWVVESPKAAVPEDAEGLLYIRRQDSLVHLDGSGETTFTGQSYKILHQQGLEAGNIAIAWNPSNGNPVVHRLLIHRDGTTTNVLEQTRFEILRREDLLEQSVLTGNLTAVLQVPDLRVGDELELAFSVRSHDPTLGEKSFGALLLGPAPPAGSIHLATSWEPGQEPRFRIAPTIENWVERDANSLDVRVVDAPTLLPPADAPPRYGWPRMVEYSDFANWEEVSATFAPLFDKAAALAQGSKIEAEIDRIAAAHDDPLSRAQAALLLVQQQVRYIYVGLAGGNFRPASADETWARRYGDCKGKTALLMALLRGLGIESEAVLVNGPESDDGMDLHLPSPGMFDHVLVRARIEGKDWWLDGTLPPVYIGTDQPAFSYRWVLPLSRKGVPLERLKFDPPKYPTEMGIYEIDARSGFDEPARVTQTMVKRGPAAVVEYLQLSALTKEQLLTGFRSAYANSEWHEIESVTYRFDESSQASILSVHGLSDVDWNDDGDGAYSLSLPGGGFSPPNKRQRPKEQDQAAPYYNTPEFSCHATTVRLPENTKLNHWGFNSVFDTMLFGRLYYRMMERADDHSIRMVRGSRIERPEIDGSAASRDNGRIENFDNSKANIYYDPAHPMTAWVGPTPVPATYETDWVNRADLCLPADVIGSDGP